MMRKLWTSLLLFAALTLVCGARAEDLEWYLLIDNDTDTWSRDQVSRYLEKKYELDISFVSAEDSGATTLIAMLASGDVPELVTLPVDTFRIRQMICQDAIWNLEELPGGAEIVESIGPELADACRSGDGELYYYPGGVRLGEAKEIALSLPALIVREDLLAKAGFSAETPDAFVRSVEGMAPYCEIGLGIMPFSSDGCLTLDRYLPEMIGLPALYSDKPWLLIQNEEYQEWLQAFSSVYRSGGMDREVFTMDTDQIGERIAQGKYGCFWGDAALYAEELQEAEAAGYRYVPVALPGKDGYLQDRTKEIGLYATVIPKNADAPSTATRVLCLLGSEEGHLLVNEGVETMMWSRADGKKEIHKAAIELFNNDIGKYNLINGGAFKYDFLSCFDKADYVYGAGSLGEIWQFYKPYMKETVSERRAGLLAQEAFVRETGLMVMRWGEELPSLLECGEQEFEMSVGRILNGFYEDGLETYAQKLHAVYKELDGGGGEAQ